MNEENKVLKLLSLESKCLGIELKNMSIVRTIFPCNNHFYIEIDWSLINRAYNNYLPCTELESFQMNKTKTMKAKYIRISRDSLNENAKIQTD